MKVLAIIDMQKDFIDGALGTKEAVAIVPKVAARLAQARADGETVVFTRDTHHADYLSTQEGQKLPVEHCIQGTPGWQLHPAIAAALGEGKIVDKPTFGSIDLMHQLVAENEKEPLALELVGLCTDICVVSNALLLKAAMPEVEITVDATCCAGVTPESHRAALATIRQCQIVVVNG